MKIKYWHQNNIIITIHLLIFVMIFILIFLRSYNYSFNFYDQGIFLTKIKKIISGDFQEVIRGHYEPYLILFKIFNSFSSSFNHAFLIFLNFLSIYSVVIYIFFKNKINSLLFILLPSIFYFFNFGFHSDILVIPLIFFSIIYFDKKKYFLSFFFLFLLLFIKEIYILNVSFILFFFYLLSKNKIYLYLTFIPLIYFLFIMLLVIETDNFLFQSFYEFNNINYLQLNFNKIIFISIALFPLLFFINKSNFLYLLPILPQIVLFIFTNSENHFKFYNHYFAPIVSVLGIYIYRSIIEIKYLYTIFIYHIFLSCSPISISFYYKYNSYLHKNAYLINDNTKLINILTNLSNKQIEISNSSNFIFMIDKNEIIPFPQGFNKKNFADLILLNKKNVYIDDKLCVFNCRDKLLEYVDLIKINSYLLIFESDNYLLFKRS